ncbi:MAG TPA: response regulator transcription factor [Allosphingosinicella sp.]|jgi:two-component system response regulator FixJ
MTDPEKALVHLVDDEDAIRRSAGFMLKTSGYRVRPFASGVELLRQARSLEPGCILLDVRMPGMDGLEVQQALREAGVALPVIIMTGHGDIAVAVSAMKAGAIDFIEKPFEKEVLLTALEQGFSRLRKEERNRHKAEEAELRIASLTPREREVLAGLAEGLANKTIAYDLGLSPRTVEIHRANLMQKLGVHSLSEALRIAFAAGMGESPE